MHCACLPDVQLSPAELARLKHTLLERHTDWSGVHAALKADSRTLSQSTLERFFNGRSRSPRTLRHIALLLNTTTEALLAHVRQSFATDQTTNARNFTPHLRNPEAFRVAYQIWVEMNTRKVGLPIDLSHDLVSEIYDSWYAFFREARCLIKLIPLHRSPTCPVMRRLVQVSHALLNDGMRPHLERWQGKFRHWQKLGGDHAQSPGLMPQQAQMLFPEWAQLSTDLLSSNRKLIGYLGVLEELLGYPTATARLTAGAQSRIRKGLRRARASHQQRRIG